MLSRRKLLSMVLIMFVLLALYMFTQVYVSSAADYDVNPYAAAVTLRRSDSWEAEAGGGTARRMVLIGGAESGIGGIVTQWCTYAKRPLNCYSSLSEYLAADNGGAQVLCIDPRCLSLPEDEARLAELAGRDLTVIFCALPDADTVMRSTALCALLGIEDIERKQLYVLTDDNGAVHAFFAFIVGDEPSYQIIDGGWLNDRPYGTIHRIASDGAVKGVLGQCLEFCRRICPDIRADTHEDNGTMRHLLEKHGFVQCGYINLDRQEGDTLRVAYQYDFLQAGKE